MDDTIIIQNNGDSLSISSTQDVLQVSEVVDLSISTGGDLVSISESEATITISESVEDAHYAHDQMIASASWTINHNLNKYPSVTIVTSAGDEVIGFVHYNSVNQVVLTFSASFAGKAYFN